MERIYQISDHPTLTGVKRELLYNRLLEDPIAETIKVMFIKRHYELKDHVATKITDSNGVDTIVYNDGVKTPVLGLNDSEDSMIANNEKFVNPSTGILVQKINVAGDGEPEDMQYPVGSVGEYSYFVALIESGANLYTVIAREVATVDSAEWGWGFNN